jgi:hypothetical protein
MVFELAIIRTERGYFQLFDIKPLEGFSKYPVGVKYYANGGSDDGIWIDTYESIETATYEIEHMPTWMSVLVDASQPARRDSEDAE